MQAVGLLMYSVPSNFRFGVTHSRRTKCINDNLSENLRRHANFFFHHLYTHTVHVHLVNIYFSQKRLTRGVYD